MADRSKDVSAALTEVRTVHSRALAALNKLDSEWAGDWYVFEDWMEANPRPQCVSTSDDPTAYERWLAAYHEYGGATMADPDHDEMIEALETVVDLLDRWEKRGRRR